MKASVCRLSPWLAVVGSVAAQNAYLYNVDINPRPAPSTGPIDSETANAIIARRLDATGSLRLGHLGDASLELLGQYGGRSQSLFGVNRPSQVYTRLVVEMEGYDGEQPQGHHGVIIDRADTDLGATRYIESLVLQDQSPTKLPCKGYLPLKTGVHVTYTQDSKSECLQADEISQVLGNDAGISTAILSTNIEKALKSNGESGSRAFLKLDMTRMKSSPAVRKADIEAAFASWYTALECLARDGKIESTILLLPSQRTPPPLNLLARRAGPNKAEEPLSESFVAMSQTNPDMANPASPSNTSSPSSHLPPLGSFLPACFASNETCISRTNSCSGHGGCYAKSRQCFVCRCGSTVVRQDSDGKNVKTVQWGGSACERKDVSVPFFLLAGFAVTMTALVAGGIGMLYTMGSEQLPSVIGAGVTGPRAQR